MRLRFAFILLLTIHPLFSCLAATAEKDTLLERCVKCHKQEVEQADLKLVIHRPFAEKQCLLCHIAGQVSSSAADGAPQNHPEKEKIHWLCNSPALSADQTFIFDARAIGKKIYIEAISSGNTRLRKQIEVPLLTAITKVPPRHLTPRISDIRTTMQQDILINVVITWHTDEKTNTVVHYVLGGPEQAISETNRFVTDHEIVLPGLKKGVTGRFSITCQDIYGNTTTSPPQTFSTSAAAASPSSALPPDNRGTGTEPIALASELFAINETVMLELKSSRPVAVTIGTSTDQLAEGRWTSFQKPLVINETGQEPHIQLNEKRFSSLAVCTTCHTAYNQQKSHPVDVLPKRGTRIPPDYPTLPDGRISCISCHANHASNHEYRLITSSRKQLCSGCHPDKF